jgi:hypothetical protein
MGLCNGFILSIYPAIPSDDNKNYSTQAGYCKQAIASKLFQVNYYRQAITSRLLQVNYYKQTVFNRPHLLQGHV